MSDRDYTVLTEPLTIQDVDIEGRLTGIVAVTVGEIIDWEFEEFLDVISDRLCDSSLLMDVDYALIGFDAAEQQLHFRVTGDASMVFEGQEPEVEDDNT